MLAWVFESFTSMQTELAALLWTKTQLYGLSLANRDCLALAMERQVPVLTADQVWVELGLGIDIQLLR